MKKNEKQHRFLGSAACGLILAGLFSFVSLAAPQAGSILYHDVNGSDVIVYLANPEDTEDYSLDIQIGTSKPECVSSAPISGEQPSVETILLLDNSLSIQNKYRDKIRDNMLAIVDDHIKGEEFSVAVFSDHIDYLTRNSSDYEDVKKTIQGITYNDQETYLTDVLCELLDELKNRKDGIFRRIVIVSDGVDNKDIGYTREELHSRLGEFPVPVYTFGCSGNDNERLKNMFALSRMTGGESMLLDDIKPSDAAAAVSQTDPTVRTVVTPAKEDRDGMKKAVRVIWTDKNGSSTGSFETQMPFGEAADSETQTPAPAGTSAAVVPAEAPAESTAAVVPAEAPAESVTETSTETSTEETLAPLPSAAKKESSSGGGGKLLLLLLLLLAAGAAIFILIRNRGKKDGKEKKEPKPKKEKKARAAKKGKEAPAPAKTPAAQQPAGVPAYVSEDDAKTVMLPGGGRGSYAGADDFGYGAPAAARYIILKEEGPGGCTHEAELSGSLIIGRNAECGIRISDTSVSRRHVKLTLRGGAIYMENLSEINGTFLNGNRISGEEPLESGDTIGIGRVRLTVTIE